MRVWGHFAQCVVILSVAFLWSGAVEAATVPEQTPVKVRLLQDLKSGHERKGEKVRLETVDEILAADRSVLIPHGTPVIGTITRSNGRGMFGKPGKLEFTIDSIKVGEQLRVPLRSTPTGARGRNNSGAAIATAVLLLPVAIFVKGREVTIAQGKEFSVYVDATTEIPTSGTPAASVTGAKPDPKRLSLIRLKNGDSVTGTILAFKDGVYTVATELGQVFISQERIDTISEKPEQPKAATEADSGS